MVGILIEYLI